MSTRGRRINRATTRPSGLPQGFDEGDDTPLYTVVEPPKPAASRFYRGFDLGSSEAAQEAVRQYRASGDLLP